MCLGVGDTAVHNYDDRNMDILDIRRNVPMHIYVWPITQCHLNQGGTDLNDSWTGADTSISGSVVLAGYTDGSWTGTHLLREDGVRDFAAMAVDEDGLQLWWFQVKALVASRCEVHGDRAKLVRCSLSLQRFPGLAAERRCQHDVIRLDRLYPRSQSVSTT